MTREEIVDKIRKVEELYSGGIMDGEVSAAAEALQRLRARLAAVPEETIEYRISLPGGKIWHNLV